MRGQQRRSASCQHPIVPEQFSLGLGVQRHPRRVQQHPPCVPVQAAGQLPLPTLMLTFSRLLTITCWSKFSSAQRLPLAWGMDVVLARSGPLGPLAKGPFPARQEVSGCAHMLSHVTPERCSRRARHSLDWQGRAYGEEDVVGSDGLSAAVGWRECQGYWRERRGHDSGRGHVPADGGLRRGPYTG